MGVRLQDLLRQSREEGDIVQDQDASSVGPQDQVTVLDLDVVHRHGREVAAGPGPAPAAVQGDHQPVVDSGEEEIGLVRMLHDAVDHRLVRQVSGDAPPGVPGVLGLEEVRPKVVVVVTGEGKVRGIRVGGGGVDLGDEFHLVPEPELVRQGLPRDAPVRSTVHASVVGPGVDQPLPERRLGHGGKGVVRSEGGFQTHDLPLGGRLIPGQVLADRLPALSPVPGSEQLVAAEIHDVRVMGGDEEGAAPVEPVGLRSVLRDRSDAAGASSHQVDPPETGVLGFGEDDGVVPGIDGRHEPVSTADVDHVLVQDTGPGVGPGGDPPRPVVLEPSVHVVGIPVVHLEDIVLGDGDVVEEAPGPGPVVGDVEAAVVAHEHVIGVLGIDPQRVVVHVDPLGRPVVLEGLSPVDGQVQLCPHDPDLVLVQGIDVDVAVPVGRLDVVDPGPRGASVLRSVQATVLVGDGSIHDIGTAPGDGDGDLPQYAFREPSREFLPRIAPIHGAVDARVGPSREIAPGVPPSLVRGGVKDAAVLLHGHLHDSRIVVDEEHPLPGPSPVQGPVQAPLFVRAPPVTGSGHKDDIGVTGMNDDPVDDPGVPEAHVLPGFPPIQGAVDTVSQGCCLLLSVRFPRSDPDDEGIGGSQGHVADGEGRAGAVEDRLPGHAVVRGLEDAPG